MATKNSSTTTNLSPNVASALCYAPVVWLIPSVIFLLIDKNPTVRWNAVQSLVFHGLFFIVVWALPVAIPLIGLGISSVVGMIVFVVELILVVKSYQGGSLKLPVLSGWADKIVKKV